MDMKFFDELTKRLDNASADKGSTEEKFQAEMDELDKIEQELLEKLKDH